MGLLTTRTDLIKPEVVITMSGREVGTLSVFDICLNVTFTYMACSDILVSDL